MLTMMLLVVYILAKRVPVMLCMYPLFTGFLAFLFLFLGSGKQKCYQTKISNYGKYKIDYRDIRLRSDQWKLGVFFYGQAVTLSILSNIVYFIPFRKPLEIYGSMGVHKYQTVFDDSISMIRIFYDK